MLLSLAKKKLCIRGLFFLVLTDMNSIGMPFCRLLNRFLMGWEKDLIMKTCFCEQKMLFWIIYCLIFFPFEFGCSIMRVSVLHYYTFLLYKTYLEILCRIVYNFVDTKILPIFINNGFSACRSRTACDRTLHVSFLYKNKGYKNIRPPRLKS